MVHADVDGKRFNKGNTPFVPLDIPRGVRVPIFFAFRSRKRVPLLTRIVGMHIVMRGSIDAANLLFY